MKQKDTARSSAEQVESSSSSTVDKPAKRGRRRKPNNSETSAEKRRTQVRIAQRAYRARQEETVTNLRARIRMLEDVAEVLSKSFLSFSDDLMQSSMLDLFPELAYSLRQTTEKFVKLANQANESPEDDNDTLEVQHKTPSASSVEEIDRSTTPRCKDILAPAHKTLANQAIQDALNGDLIGAKNLLQVPSRRPRNSIPSPTIQLQLRPPMSPLYGAQSPFFAERLHWVCTDRAYGYLKNPAVPDWKLTPAFGYLMGIMNRQQISAYFGTCLEYCWSTEVLDQCNVPMISIGGAGSHYPRLHDTGDQVSLPTDELVSRYANAFTAEEFEELWFDPADVEGFLEEYGIILIEGSKPLSAQANLFGPRPSRKPLFALDESKLITWLSLHAICLGRMAGFRKRDVESYVLQYAWSIE